MHASSVSICLPLLTGSHYNVQAVESDYDDDESARPMLPPGSSGIYPSNSNDATIPGRVNYQEYSKIC